MTIGPKCQLCGKGAKYHSAVYKLCPMGKRRRCPITLRIMYEDSHPTNKFTPREPKKRKGSEARKDRVTRRAVKAEPCVVCWERPGNPHNPVDCCHIRSWAISQCDEPWNQLPACRRHHQIQHQAGWLWMTRRYPSVAQALKERGWEFQVNESTGDWSMFNPLEVEFQKRRRCV